jgi:putative membrane protein insertion efficiency factor
VRQRLKQRNLWLGIAALALGAAALFDWAHSPEEQVSVGAYERFVIAPYRSFARPVLSKFVRCRFEPTCSEYSLQAVRTHGLAKGVWLTMGRLVRCAPWTKPGTRDPVPPSRTARANQ